MNDNDRAFITTKVEILKGRHEGESTPRWFINMCFSDGTEIIVGDRLDHASAVSEAEEAAAEDGVAVVDLSPEGLAA